MMMFKIWIFDFDLSSLVSFFVGIFLGCALLGIFYAIIVISSSRNKKFIVSVANDDVDEAEIKEIIENSRKQFNDQTLKGASSTIAHCKDICFSLAIDISRKFFPKSKRPFAELTLDELLSLAVYISDRINQIVDRPGLRLVKKLKLSTILSFGDAKKVIDDSELMKLTRKYKIKKAFTSIKSALNIINPVYWVKRTVVNTSLDFAVKKLCLAVIGVVGEEVYKIYSKRVFNEEKLIDANVKELVAMIDEDLKDVTDDDFNDYLLTESVSNKLGERKKKKYVLEEKS